MVTEGVFVIHSVYLHLAESYAGSCVFIVANSRQSHCTAVVWEFFSHIFHTSDTEWLHTIQPALTNMASSRSA